MVINDNSEWASLVQHPEVQALLDLAIAEDMGDAGDVTTDSIFLKAQQVQAVVAARTETVVCGIHLAHAIMKRFDPELEPLNPMAEGTIAQPGQVLFQLNGDIRSILKAERTILNFMIRLCGIANGARIAADQVPDDCSAKIYDTRKTTPGWRLLEKAAVKTGGAFNHRVGLFDAVLIKDNHIAAAGSLQSAIEMSRAKVGTSMIVQVEIDGLDQLDEALSAGPDIILLDNFSDKDLKDAVTRTAGRAQLEASGGIGITDITRVAQTGVDRISMGALTHTVVPADLGLDMLEE
ncbi:MAG: carboxylating nicotinate-nucleotide diphosphorylase [Deltaproteobacteria bacterium]|jgi:nicotinate-nucleotide pyrophosphorylase (carboxylating)|nr:carboxylating nicotinate-nucleotide diphosphorylase [Deltaproteobacteria bacterium]MBT6436079.1 carboxylating nicotinate-nucleotide diphosphorylase [Deltaproteobacteria bacterium]MBT6488367.1 carboxylating nicotinate-nucleotide diphosphorylase [Deltaproteobacteria bacterium]